MRLMTRREMTGAIAPLFFAHAAAIGQKSPLDPKSPGQPSGLPLPDRHGGRPLLQVLSARKSTKSFEPQPLSEETLSTLLWAAFGVNRPDSRKRTAASAMNSQDIDIYVVRAQGVCLYQAQSHKLTLVSAQNVCALAATQDYARQAPVHLIYVSDSHRIDDLLREKKPIYGAFHAGSISQNVYLFCASEGLGTVVRDSVDRAALGKALKLRPNQSIVMAQTVGYPK